MRDIAYLGLRVLRGVPREGDAARPVSGSADARGAQAVGTHGAAAL